MYAFETAARSAMLAFFPNCILKEFVRRGSGMGCPHVCMHVAPTQAVKRIEEEFRFNVMQNAASFNKRSHSVWF